MLTLNFLIFWAVYLCRTSFQISCIQVFKCFSFVSITVFCSHLSPRKLYFDLCC
ncbi:unnamed protein product [Moneuplotes crassus]|uniref:Uncharacterized protein n=1 Tax=Euplotes crassus TaxID=5936 RepID=A0AAD1XN41_EUPCR|nr:unnamed protein product [Moneuplotes crassus]